MKKNLFYAVTIALMFFCTISTYAQEPKKPAFANENKMGKLREEQIKKEFYEYKYDNTKRERSELQLTKSFQGETLSTIKSFDVESTAENLFIAVFGKAKSGKISIKIIQPDGKEYKEIEIDNSSDVKWENLLNLTEKKENMTGKWKIQINTDKAEGTYLVRINTR